ncbi:exported hypothetical protein [Xenorhabdus szentirmaii DSM 16338]|uniref:Uncharacterized protein n=1 Tax=Xenorhabdus szentirmaii DSM 16338 TaxID=1427518 RepID=W1IRF5_9GAMM|nr:exported hypothetical protein [Xenorhabdus szentirmaii DSM 16338]
MTCGLSIWIVAAIVSLCLLSLNVLESSWIVLLSNYQWKLGCLLIFD